MEDLEDAAREPAGRGGRAENGCPVKLGLCPVARKELPALAADEGAVVHYGREFFRMRR